MNKAIHTTDCTAKEKGFLSRIERNLPIVADLSRADILMCVPVGNEFVVVSQARPHSMAPIHPQDIAGQALEPAEASQVAHILASGKRSGVEVQRWGDRAPMVREMLPVLGPDARNVAVVCIETNLIEHERHKRRHANFRRALTALQKVALCEEIVNVGEMLPFGEQDGIVFVDPQKRIRYLSGIATNFYRRLGYMDPLVGQYVEYLETGDDEIVGRSLSERRCFREEAKAQDREWVRQTIPVPYSADRFGFFRRLLRRDESYCEKAVGVFLLVHDQTEMRRRQRELQVKSAMIQETHHRVKNNLQTIAALLRMEARRTSSEEAKRILEESMNRILSISVVHEFMANEGARLINLREVGQRLVSHVRQLALSPERQLNLTVTGSDIFLPSQQATVCSLVINELLQNAIEHGFAAHKDGEVVLRLAETSDKIVIEVSDNGIGLPEGFDLQRDVNMGLNIVQVLVRDDLKGEVKLVSNGGVIATVKFPKISEEVNRLGTD